MEIKHWCNDSFPAESMLAEKGFTITIKKNVVELECEWDYGWESRGDEHIFIPLEILEKFVADHKEALANRRAAVNRKEEPC